MTVKEGLTPHGCLILEPQVDICLKVTASPLPRPLSAWDDVFRFVMSSVHLTVKSVQSSKEWE